MAQLQAGDESAFDALFSRHKGAVFALIFRYFNDHDLAEDLTQETFVRVYEARATYKPTHAVRSWMYGIATNLCLNTLRNRKRERSLEGFEREGGDRPVEFADPRDRGPQGVFLQSETGARVAAALQRLPETQRLLIVLVYYDDLSIAEAARIVGLTALGARLRLFRARERLRRHLGPLWHDETNQAGMV